jgi:tetratricopeptide (TPR) repeat protein
LVELCGRLPLALRIAAARLRSHPAWDLTHLVQRLRDRRHRLVELQAGPRSVTAALDLSYQDLRPEQRCTYRMLGLHPGADIEPYAAAALLDISLLEAGRRLEHLLEAHLLQEPVPGRYRFHDLTRAHAAHTASLDEPDRQRAVDRLLDYYRSTDHYQRLLDLAQQRGNRNWQFEAWQGLGRLHHATGRADLALTHHRQALALAVELDQPDDQARAHNGLAHAHHALHQLGPARAHWQHALAILERLGIDRTDDEDTTIAAIRAHLDHDETPDS